MDEQAIVDNNYTDKYLFYFEKKFERKDLLDLQVQWTLNNWTLSIYYSIGYIILVFLGRRFMRNRDKFRLNRSLIAWNILHSVFSVLGAIRLVPGFVDMLYTQGLDYSICEAKYDYGIIGEWSSLFVISKMVDLFDTAFIILRKQNLLFLHWYHHTASLIYSWHSFKELASTGRFFSVMNISAHALMYPYYLCRSLRFNVPKFVMISITSLQTLQMVVGVYVNFYALMKKNRGEYCRVSYENIYWSFIMYFTFFTLFANFFINRYLKKLPRIRILDRLKAKSSWHNLNRLFKEKKILFD